MEGLALERACAREGAAHLRNRKKFRGICGWGKRWGDRKVLQREAKAGEGPRQDRARPLRPPKQPDCVQRFRRGRCEVLQIE